MCVCVYIYIYIYIYVCVCVCVCVYGCVYTRIKKYVCVCNQLNLPVVTVLDVTFSFRNMLSPPFDEGFFFKGAFNFLNIFCLMRY